MEKLDLKTKLFLYITRANVLEIPSDDRYIYKIEKEDSHNVYVFNNYKEYVNYYKKYLNNVDDRLIKAAILRTTKSGQIIVFKGLCDRIIIKGKAREFYDRFNLEKIDEIHSKGKITPMEKAEEYLSFDVCAPGDAIGSASDRCEFFSDCYECMLEYLSCNEEYDKFDFKLVNSYTPKKVKIKKTL